MYMHVDVSDTCIHVGMLLLAQWLNRQPEELPKDAETIIEYCRGSPMVIALIGAILKKNPNSDRKWKLILEKLKKKHFHSIKLHASVNEWSYQHGTLNTSIELSVESLPQHLEVCVRVLTFALHTPSYICV